MKEWWILIIKTLVFLALFLVVDTLLGPLFLIAKDKALERHPNDLWLKTSYAVEKVDADCLVIGSSTSIRHYDPALIEKGTGLSTYNCGQDGCFFLYSCCLINTILERYSPQVVILDINPGNLLDVERKDEYQNMRFLSYYYDKDPVVRKYVDSKGERNKLLYHLNCCRYNSHFIYTFYPLVHETPTQLGYSPLPPKKHALKKVKKQVSWEGNWMVPKLSELDNLIDNCKKKGTELIVVTSPYYADFDDSAMKKCDEFAEMLSRKGIKYINFLNKAPYNTDYLLYRDNSHMNAKGAEIMSDTIAKIIRSMRSTN